MIGAHPIPPAPSLARRFRLAFAALLALAACGGGGGGGGGPPPSTPTLNPNPAPEPDPVATIDMAGSWRLDAGTFVSGTPDPLPLGTILFVENNQVRFVLLPGNVLLPTLQEEIVDDLGFGLDWYQNFGDGSFLDYGYGWDLLNFPVVTLSHPDYLQYGLRLIATNSDTLTGFEARWTQDDLGTPRTEWVAALTFTRM